MLLTHAITWRLDHEMTSAFAVMLEDSWGSHDPIWLLSSISPVIALSAYWLVHISFSTHSGFPLLPTLQVESRVKWMHHSCSYTSTTPSFFFNAASSSGTSSNRAVVSPTYGCGLGNKRSRPKWNIQLPGWSQRNLCNELTVVSTLGEISSDFSQTWIYLGQYWVLYWFHHCIVITQIRLFWSICVCGCLWSTLRTAWTFTSG